MKKTKTKKIKFLKCEKLMYFILVLLCVLIPISNVFTKGLLSETNIEKETLKKNIAKEVKINESLSMQIDELASLDNIKKIAAELGLSYISDNIKTVTGE